MTCKIIDPRIFIAIANRMDYAANHAQQDFYSIPAWQFMTKAEIHERVCTWFQLHIEGYNLTHEPNFSSRGLTLKIEFGQLPITPYQFLKWSRLVFDHIAYPLIEKTRALQNSEVVAINLLNTLIFQTMERIVDSLPEFQDTKIEF